MQLGNKCKSKSRCGPEYFKYRGPVSSVWRTRRDKDQRKATIDPTHTEMTRTLPWQEQNLSMHKTPCLIPSTKN